LRGAAALALAVVLSAAAVGAAAVRAAALALALVAALADVLRLLRVRGLPARRVRARAAREAGHRRRQRQGEASASHEGLLSVETISSAILFTWIRVVSRKGRSRLAASRRASGSSVPPSMIPSMPSRSRIRPAMARSRARVSAANTPFTSSEKYFSWM